MTTIRYFVPEDGDLETEPNVFLAPKSRHPNSPPSFGQIRDAFPLPGQYHFRFKSALVPGTDRDKSAMAVWMDVFEERQPVPTWRGSIVAKVSRIGAEDDDEDDDDEDDEDFHRPAVAAPSPVAATPKPTPPPQQHHHGSSVGSAGSIDDLFGATTTTTPTPAPGGASLLDFNDHHHAPATAHNDFLGMTAHPPSGIQSAPTSGGYHGNPGVYGQQQQQQQHHMHMQQQQQQQHVRQPQYGGYGQQQQPQGGGGGAFGDLQWS